MKIARLHDGTELYFPPEMPDAEMDARVQQHLMRGQAQNPAEDAGQLVGLVPQLLKMYAAHTQQKQAEEAQREQAESERAAQREQAADERETVRRQEDTQLRITDIEQRAIALRDLGEGVQQALTASLGPLVELADNTGQIGDLIKVVNNLSATVLESTQIIVAALRMPKAIQHDAEGVPRALVPMETKQTE